MRRFLGSCTLVFVVIAGSAAVADPGAAPATATQSHPTVYTDNPYVSAGALQLDVRLDVASQVPEAWRQLAAASSSGRPDPYRLIKFAGPVGSRERERIAAAGYTIVSYQATNAFLVRPTAGPPVTAPEAIEGVIWSGAFHPYFKVSDVLAEPLARGDASPFIVAEDNWGLRFAVRLHEPHLEAHATTSIAAAPGVLQVLPVVELPIRVQVDPQQFVAFVQAVAALPEVVVVEPWMPRKLDNDENVQTGQSGNCINNGDESLNTAVFNKGITGWNARLAIADSCTDSNEGWWYDDALGRLPAHEPDAPFTSVPPDWAQRKMIEYYDMYSGDTTIGCASSSTHGTHTAGTIAANCSLNAEGIATQTDPANSDGDQDGMAPGAKLIVQDLGGDSLLYLNGNGGTVGGLFNIAYYNTCLGVDCGIDAHNNSWGADANIYDFDCQTGDNALWTTQRGLIVASAGNAGSGYNTVGTPATAKNIIAVGNASDCQTNFMNGGSSRGKAPDGRLKPDVVAVGTNVTSALNDGNGSTNANQGCSTVPESGTSMSSPTMTGYSGLIMQYFNDGFYPGGAANTFDAIEPSGPLMKAMLLAAGRRMTDAATAEPNGVTWPNMVQGWGFVVLDDALYFVGDARNLWVHDEVIGVDTSGTTSRTFRRKVTSSLEPLKVTLVWYDIDHAGGCGGATPCLDNDLDLTVTNVTSGGTYSVTLATGTSGHKVPRTVVPSGPAGIGQVTVSSGPDNLNTAEQIIIYSPAVNNIYSFTVSAANTPNGSIPFALAATGALADPCTAPSGLAPSTAVDPDSCVNGGVLVSWSADPAAWNDGGGGTRSYRVFRDGAPIRTGPCAGNLPYGTTSCADNSFADGVAAKYRVEYVSGCGSTAHTADISAADTADFLVDVTPSSAEGCPGGPIALSAAADEPGSYSYQWTEDGQDLPGEISNSLSVTKGAPEAHTYNCEITQAGSCTNVDVTPTVATWIDSPASVNYNPASPPIGTLTQVCGDNDSNVERGEIWSVNVGVLNASQCTAAFDVTAEIAVNATSAVAATVCNPTGSFGTIAPQDDATDGYAFEVSETAACPGALAFDVNNVLWSAGGPTSDDNAFLLPVSGQCNVTTTCSCAGIVLGEVSGVGAAVPLTVERAGSNVKLTFQKITGATHYNVYVSTLASTLPFEVTTPGVGKKSCSVAWNGVLGGKAVIQSYDVDSGFAPNTPVLYILVSGDKGIASEGSLGFTSDATPRDATFRCAD